MRLKMFKRFYWSGSKAKFIGVDWRGNPDGPYDAFAPDYHLASMNSFASAERLAGILNSLSSEPKTVIGHSMGALLTAFAVDSFSMQTANACLVDAAIASECFDGNGAENLLNMAYEPWTQANNPDLPNYPRQLWAADWHKLFLGGNDARQTLTWKNNFTSIVPETYNFYSSTEDVLAVFPGTPNSTVIYNVLHFDFARHAWVVQEKAKGNVAKLFGLVGLTGTDYGGWGFNFHDPLLAVYPSWYVVVPDPAPGHRRMMTTAEINARTDDWLNGSKFAPLFNSGWGSYDLDYPAAPVVNTLAHSGPDWILDLYSPANGSAIAADSVKRVQLLSQAIPSLSTPIGQRPLLSLQPSQRNYPMPEMFAPNGYPWPTARGREQSTQTAVWHHSDIRDVAYLYVYGFFDSVTIIANTNP